MAISEYKLSATTDFRGPRLRREDTDLPSDSARESVNIEYENGNFRTRYGFGEVWNPNEAIATMFNWQKGNDALAANGNYLIYYNPVNGNVRYVPGLTTPFTPATLFNAVGGYGAVHASAGTRLYTSVFNTAGEGHTECQVSDGFDSTGVVSSHKAFPAPMSTAPSLSAPGAGFVTAGFHRVGYYILSRSGHRGKLAPFSSGVFAPATFTSTGTGNIQFSLTATWPADAVSVWVVMTTASNLNRYIAVPGATAAVTGGANSTVTITISITDDDLLSTGTEVTDYQLWMTQNGAGSGPFKPSHVFEVGQRMGYLTTIAGISQVYISEFDQYQQITADQHLIELPGQRKIVAPMVMPDGTVYLLGPSWTYATRDTGERPVLWPTPRLVDGRIGTMSPTGVVVNASRGLAWIADQGGLYVFADGQYSEKPISQEVESDWQRINWAYAYEVKVKDDKDHNRVLVSAPIDNSTAANAIFVFDYTDGIKPEAIRYSFWTIDNYFHAALETVYNPVTKKREVWVGSATTGGEEITGKVLRQKNGEDDANPYNDDGNGISWIYETAPFPSHPIGVNAHHMVRMRAKGTGTASLLIRRQDQVSSAGPYTLVLSESPNNDMKKQFYLKNTPSVTYRFTGNSADAYLQLSKLESYWTAFSGL